MATIYDVAKAAKVSPKTVSRVLNGDAPVGEKTRAAVEKAIADLGYVPSSAARAMRSNRTGLVGLVTGAISHTTDQLELSGLPDLYIVQGVQRALERADMTLLISDSYGQQDRVPGLFRTFLQHRVEGIIYVADYHRQVTLPPVPEGTRLVLANCYDEAGHASVLPDDYHGQLQIVRKVLAQGHRRIAYLTLSNHLDATRLRTEGYRQALEEVGVDFDPELVVEADKINSNADTEVRMLWAAIDRILSLPVPPTAICFGNDRMAMRAYGMLRSRGIELPRDMSVAGYDNHRAIADSLFPTLSTVALPYPAMGERAAELLLAQISNTDTTPTQPELIRGDVHWRDSVQTPGRDFKLFSTQGRNSV